MRLGMFSMPLHPPERSVTDTYDDDFATFELADRLGYDEIWLGEHFTSVWENVPAPDLFIAQAAARTKRVRFATGVLLMPFHNPLHAALRLAQLDHQTHGRLIVGFGSGGLSADKAAFGIELTAEQSGQLTREGIDAIVGCWQGEPFSYDGEFFKLAIGPERPETRTGVLMRPYQTPHPPIALAGVSRGSYGLGYAGERGWIPVSTNFLHPTPLATHWDAYAQGAQRAGRTAERSIWRIARDIHVAETTEQAVCEVREGAMGRAYTEYMFPLVSGTRGLLPFKEHPEMADSDVTLDYLLENTWIVGSPDECVRRLRRLGDQLGGFGTVLQIAHDWAPNQEIFHRSMELLATRVIPALEAS